MSQNQTTGRNYQEVEAGGSNNQRWEPQKNENNPNYPKEIEGYFKSLKELPGQNGAFHVAEIQLMEQDGRTLGICVDVSGGKVLADKLNKISLNSWVMIRFNGKVKGKLNTYNDWSTFVDENAVPLNQLIGIPNPTNQQQVFQQQPVQQAPVQQQPVFGQPVQQAPAFGQPVQNVGGTQQQFPVQQVPAFGQPQQQAPVFGGQQQSPAFGQPIQQNAAPVFNQQQGGQMPGVQQGTNPFGNQVKDDLPF